MSDHGNDDKCLAGKVLEGDIGFGLGRRLCSEALGAATDAVGWEAKGGEVRLWRPGWAVACEGRRIERKFGVTLGHVFKILELEYVHRLRKK